MKLFNIGGEGQAYIGGRGRVCNTRHLLSGYIVTLSGTRRHCFWLGLGCHTGLFQARKSYCNNNYYV